MGYKKKARKFILFDSLHLKYCNRKALIFSSTASPIAALKSANESWLNIICSMPYCLKDKGTIRKLLNFTGVSFGVRNKGKANKIIGLKKPKILRP